MKKYAYLDNANILHITKYEADAKRCVKKIKDKDDKIIKMWPIVMTDFPSKGGYPINEDEENLVLFAEDFEKHDREIPEKLAELYNKLK